jgi:hypothetical protein
LRAPLRTRLAELLDKQDICDVILKYCRGVDRRDRALIESVYVAVTDEHGDVQSSGKALADRLLLRPRTDPPTTHIVGNQLAEVDGDSGYCESYFVSILEVEREGRKYTRMRGGRYLSQLERRDGEWKIARHVTVDDWDREDEIVRRVADIGAQRGSATEDDPVYRLRDQLAP